MLNPAKLPFIALDPEWTDDQREKYNLFTQAEAIDYFNKVNEANFGTSRFKWAVYYLVKYQDLTGVEVILGKLLGTNKKWLDNLKKAEDEGAVF